MLRDPEAGGGTGRSASSLSLRGHCAGRAHGPGRKLEVCAAPIGHATPLAPGQKPGHGTRATAVSGGMAATSESWGRPGAPVGGRAGGCVSGGRGKHGAGRAPSDGSLRRPIAH